MPEQISLAFLVDAFLVLFFKAETPLSPPIEIKVNGKPLQRPFVAVPFEGLKDCAVIVRLASAAKAKSLELRVGDSKELSFAWHEKELRDYEGARTALGPARIGLLCSRLYKHLDANFGPLDEEVHRRIAYDLAHLAGTQAYPLANGLIYFRSAHAAQNTRTLHRIELATPAQIMQQASGAPAWALISDGWLHCVFDPKASGVSPHQPLFAKISGSTCFPVILPGTSAVPLAGEPLTAALLDYPGDKEPVLEFIAGMATGQTAKEKSPSLRGGIDRLQGDQLLGWAQDPAQPERPVKLELLMDGQRVATLTAKDWTSLPDQAERVRAFSWKCKRAMLDGTPHRFELRIPGQDEIRIGTPFLIGQGVFDGDFSLTPSGSAEGWLSERCAKGLPVTLELHLDGAACGTSLIRQANPAPFSLPLPPRAHDGKPHDISVVLSREGTTLGKLGKGLRYKSLYRGSVTHFMPIFIGGWIVNESAPESPVSLDLVVNGKIIATAPATRPGRMSDGRPCGFEFTFQSVAPMQAQQVVSLRISGTDTEVLGPPRLNLSYQAALRSLMKAAALLKSNESTPGESEWLRRQVLAPLISSMRKSGKIPDETSLHLSPTARLAGAPCRENPVDVIVPVYKGTRQTLECIESVIRGAGKIRFRLVIINDRSPEPDLTEALRRLARQQRITLLENERNLGFVASVNRGMHLSQDRDVVLLNSDTLVPPGWLDRLVKAAYRNPAIGTVTPFSNNATIASFPLPCRDNGMPAGWSLPELDQAFFRANGDTIIDLPTAIGFCMFIKRQALDDIGFFDEDQWGHGYGEENDFSLRASALGWRNVLACGVFVQHHGSVSFGKEKPARLTSNLEKLNRLYPDYPALVNGFIAEDPPAAARNPVALALLKRHASEYLLFVTHRLGGGTKVATDDLARRLNAEGIQVLELSAGRDGSMEVRPFGLSCMLAYRPSAFDGLMADLRTLGIRHIHFHQTLFFPPEICSLPEMLGVSYDVTCHDFQFICPRINMIDETGWYCGESQFKAETCDRCVKVSGLDKGVDPLFAAFSGSTARWRKSYGEFLRRARTVLFPSLSTQAIIERHFTLSNGKAKPHPENRFPLASRPRQATEGIHSIAVIGAIGSHKGYEILQACARNAAKEGLPLRFVVIGYSMDDQALCASGNVVVTGEFRAEELPALIERHECRVAAFLSPWPETYSYTLSEAWRHGLFPVAFDLGAQAERIRAAGHGRILPCILDPKAINRALLETADSVPVPKKRSYIGQEYADLLEDYYETSAFVQAPPEAPS